MVTRWLYLGLIGLVVVQRLGELRLAEGNARRALAAGGVESGQRHYPWMVTLHTLFLVSCVAEVWLLRRPFEPFVAGAMLVLLGAATALRYAAIRALGPAWTTRVIVRPGAPRVASGPYCWLRHPNYLAVVIEIAALPLVHGAWWTALVFSAANAVLLATRIRVENEALTRLG